jgi:glycosyltransferase involved in cell wall biosynthesis
MHIVILSKTFVAAPAQRLLEHLAAQPGIDVTLITPPAWRAEDGNEIRFEAVHHKGYQVVILPIALNGQFHLYRYLDLAAVLDDFRPDVLHIDEEPFNVATFLGMWQARRRHIPTLVVTWQNILRRFPPPFNWMERFVLRSTSAIIAGNEGAAQVMHAKGYTGPLHTFSLHGIAPELWPPRSLEPPLMEDSFTVGYVGRMTPEKGGDLLLRAIAATPPRVRLRMIGNGPAIAEWRALAATLGIVERVEWHAALPAQEIPAAMRALDALALPSRRRVGWQEQFGRVLIEAMASGVPVIGASSGEIPQVIGDAGIVVPEEDAAALARAIADLAADPARWQALAQAGRARALACFTHESIARRLAEVYRHVRAASLHSSAVNEKHGS